MSSELAASWRAAFEAFHVARKPNGDAVAELALANFHEVTHCHYICVRISLDVYWMTQMRDRVADRSFLLQKRVENRLENAFESKFRSGYSMVCYGSTTGRNVTYHKALILGRVQVSSLESNTSH